MTTCWRLVATFVRQLPAAQYNCRISRKASLRKMHCEPVPVCVRVSVKQMRRRGETFLLYWAAGRKVGVHELLLASRD